MLKGLNRFFGWLVFSPLGPVFATMIVLVLIAALILLWE